MADLTWALSSCALILAVIAIRAVFGRRMRPGLRYALWGLVLLRLLVPVQLFAAPWGVAAALPEDMTEKNVYVFPMERIPVMDAGDFAGALQANPSIPIEKMDPNSFGYSRVSPDGTAIVRYADKWSVSDILRGVWLVGIGVTAAVFLVSNARFYARLRKRRRLLEADGPLRVYAVENLSSSCLFGNAVYAAAETAEDGARLRHVLAHELSHYRHGDHVWTLLRCAALALHWYNPLVWWAAALSRQDSELCADAGALRRLGEAERESYGATLIELSARHAPRAPLLCTATTMTNGKRPLRERVTMIARRPRMTAAVVIAVLLIAAVAAGCAFAGEKEQREFPMDGRNVSALDTDRILTQISTAEKLEDPSALCVNADQFEVDLTPEFDWANDGAIRYFYTKDRMTYGAQLRVFADNNTFFITESQPWPEQSRFYKLEHYLDALKYLPQEEIRLLSQDADQYIVRFAEDGVPEDFERAVCYSANGAAELDGWYIHLIALPEHGVNGGYHGSGDEAIHLFYGGGSAEPARWAADPDGDGTAEHLAAAAALPAYVYTGDDPYLAAVCKWSVGNEGLRRSDGDVRIPAPLIVDIDDSDPEDVLVWGNFHAHSYTLLGTTLLSVSGGENPALLHLKPADGGYAVAGAEHVGDGSAYAESMRRIFGARRMQKLNVLDPQETRLRFIAEYADANGLNITQVQDYGWPPAALPGRTTSEAAQHIRRVSPMDWSLDYDLREFSHSIESADAESFTGVGDLQGVSIRLRRYPDEETARAQAGAELGMTGKPRRTAAVIGTDGIPATKLRDASTRDDVVKDAYLLPLPDGSYLAIFVRNTYFAVQGDPVVQGADAVLEKTLATFRLTGNGLAASMSETQNADGRLPDVMGLFCRYRDTEVAPHHYVRGYYAETGKGEVQIAESFGFEIDDHIVDLDGDGMTELVCSCVYGGDGAQRVYVYRRSGNLIERGSIVYDRLNLTAWENWGANSTVERYVPESRKIVVEYASLASSSGDGTTPGTFTREAGYEDFAWEEYAEIS